MKTFENLWKSMKINETLWKSMKNRWTSMNINESQWSPDLSPDFRKMISLKSLLHKIQYFSLYELQFEAIWLQPVIWKSMKINENQWNAMKSCKKRWKTIKVDESQWQFMKIDEN